MICWIDSETENNVWQIVDDEEERDDLLQKLEDEQVNDTEIFIFELNSMIN